MECIVFWGENLRQMASDPMILNKPFFWTTVVKVILNCHTIAHSIFFLLMGGCIKQKLPKLLLCLNILKNKCLKSHTFIRDLSTSPRVGTEQGQGGNGICKKR